MTLVTWQGLMSRSKPTLLGMVSGVETVVDCRADSKQLKEAAVEPRFNEPLFNELLGLTNNIFRPVKSYSKIYGTESRFNEP